MTLRRITRLWADQRGVTAVVFAATAPLLLLGSAAATDYFHWTATQARLQRAADSAALAAARELTLSNRDPIALAAVARRYAVSQLTKGGEANSDITTQLIDSGRAVSVEIKRPVEPMLGRFYAQHQLIIQVRAVGRAAGSSNVCAIGLSGSDLGAVAIRMNARITANGCAIYSNSKSSLGLFAYDGAVVTASLICSAGGIAKLGMPSLTPAPTLDCPSIGDPLAGRADPPIGACTANNMVINGGVVTLNPGVYCGGLKVQAAAKVTLNAGVYVFKDGPLVVTGLSSFSGKYVGIFFKDSGVGFLNLASLLFMKDSTIDLSAPKDGPMAGVLLSESAGNRLVTHFITSDDARNLLGTLYLPRGILTIDGERPVADRSAYTVILARNLKLEQGPNLYLNANYGGTDVPVPKGVGPIGSRVTLGN